MWFGEVVRDSNVVVVETIEVQLRFMKVSFQALYEISNLVYNDAYLKLQNRRH